MLQIGNKTVKSISKGNQDIVLIVRNSDDSVIYRIEPVASVVLSVDKTVLNYADNEYATLTAVVEDANGNRLPNRPVDFSVVGGDQIGSTQYTNQYGIATVTYQSKGIGDISIRASVGSILSETYAIEDCHFYNDLTTSASDSKFTIGSNATVTHDNKGMKIYCGVNGKGNESESNQVVLNESLPSGDWEVSFTFTDGNQYDMLTNIDGLNFDRTDSTGSTQILLWKITNHDWNTFYDPSIYISVAKNDVIKVQKQNNVFSIYVNDTLATTINYDSTYATAKFIMASCCGTRWTQSKNLKIKQL